MTRDFDDWDGDPRLRHYRDKPKGTFNDKTNTTPDTDIDSFTPTTASNFELHKRIKELEELGRNSHNSNYIRIAELEDKVEKLEQWQKITKINDIWDLSNRIVALEEWKRDAPSLSRLEKLEEWKSDYKSDGEVIKNLFKKYSDRIEDLEEWRNNPPTRLSLIETQIMQLEESRADDLKRIKELEEWKQQNTGFEIRHPDTEDRIKEIEKQLKEFYEWRELTNGRLYKIEAILVGHKNYFDSDLDRLLLDTSSKKEQHVPLDHKVIDKQVWEYIKFHIRRMDRENHKLLNHPINPIGVDFRALKGFIKQVDPEWEPGK